LPPAFGQAKLTIDSCIFKSNSALLGGAIYAGAATTIISNSLFEKNLAVEGADIYTGTAANVKIIGCTFGGAGVSSFDSGIYCESGKLEIRESLLHNLSPVKSFLVIVPFALD